MTILQGPIERKLSALLGAEVKFEQFKVSLLSGSVEVAGVRVGEFLTVARAVVQIAVKRALKGEIVVKSLTIERPQVDLPKRPRRPERPAKSPTAPAADEPSEKTRWTFDIEKVLVLDGDVRISDRLAISKLLLELKRSDAGYLLTVLADKVADGQLRASFEFNTKLTLAQLLALL